MATKTIVKLVLLGLITLLAFVAVVCGKFVAFKKKKRTEQEKIRLTVKIRLGCFLLMLVLILICLFI